MRAALANRYSGIAIALHWLGALLLFCGFGLGLFMTGLEFSPAKFRYYAWHKWLGITVFLVAAARLAWRAGHPPPPLPPAMPAWQVRAARGTHALLYALMLAIPVSGWLYSSATGVSVVYLGLLPLPNLVAKDKELARVLLAAHQALNFTLATAVLLHVAATLRHHWVDRDGLLARMLP
ncbi:MAG: cytochrome b [Casimicrobiaceae bacterium]